MSGEESGLVKIALVSCGSEYAGVQPEFEEAAAKVNAKFIYPEIDVASIDTIGRDFGLEVASGDLRLMMPGQRLLLKAQPMLTGFLLPPVSAVPKELLYEMRSEDTFMSVLISR
jgi:activator of 2-hydroxyglutaryl-CoA dehydratase